ncbi:hypothetical protein [Collinsella sp. An2]|uniref:lipase family protein n=1 Tax=Collinsella sp. An2 TaxID=1965585 RepID=UPI000B39AA05|nr:hypothetical protein [Collinsella sp. An2]OUP10424.1 hypothetical protein B5F33_02275 [Collinsella sp. An2]
MLRSGMQQGGFRRMVRRAMAAAGMALLVVGLALGFGLVLRYQVKCAAVAEAQGLPAPLDRTTPEALRSAREVPLTLTLLDVPGEHELRVTWDDAWFGRASASWNSELALTCAALSTLAYSESGHYQEGSQGPAYMEQALEQLGFSEVSTDSYRFRSEVADQVLNVFTQDEDLGAYTVARRRLAASGDDGSRSVIVVAVRGSYGSEWLSNADLSSSGDHPGYRVLADEIAGEVGRWVDAAHAQGDAVTVLTCGHSRGGAIAGMVAARAIDGDVGAQWGADDEALGYTFAAPCSTTDASARSARYDTIVNVVNTADLVPRLPLATWGYVRFGRDVSIGMPSGASAEDAAGMREAYRALTGVLCAHEPMSPSEVETLLDELSGILVSPDSLADPVAVAHAAAVVAAANPLRLLAGHYPSVYLAWLEALATG